MSEFVLSLPPPKLQASVPPPPFGPGGGGHTRWRERGVLRFANEKCYHILTILPLRSAMPIQDMNIHSAISSGGITRQRQYIGADVFIS